MLASDGHVSAGVSKRPASERRNRTNKRKEAPGWRWINGRIVLPGVHHCVQPESESGSDGINDASPAQYQTETSGALLDCPHPSIVRRFVPIRLEALDYTQSHEDLARWRLSGLLWNLFLLSWARQPIRRSEHCLSACQAQQQMEAVNNYCRSALFSITLTTGVKPQVFTSSSQSR